eukprot:TRINITY_DN8101_c0_g1_i2.p1 TRINITY_DN8101_c0_g1~~TRINITY_DN8101_c0_g1_i2.p1  ORF type:complete len:114 (-),score=23.49 TRINITY_DN8101_c0_g1_i2:47-388(-)
MTSTASKKEVAESSFEFLHIELVHYLERRHKQVATEHKDDNDLISLETPYTKLELMGFRVGQRLIERMCRDHPRFNDNLEIIKYICKEVWNELFKKQIDNLRTNHRVSHRMNK